MIYWPSYHLSTFTNVPVYTKMPRRRELYSTLHSKQGFFLNRTFTYFLLTTDIARGKGKSWKIISQAQASARQTYSYEYQRHRQPSTSTTCQRRQMYELSSHTTFASHLPSHQPVVWVHQNLLRRQLLMNFPLRRTTWTLQRCTSVVTRSHTND